MAFTFRGSKAGHHHPYSHVAGMRSPRALSVLLLLFLPVPAPAGFAASLLHDAAAVLRTKRTVGGN
jgi:hypothetical protein